MLWTVLLLAGVGAGTLGGIVGFGSSMIMLPLLVWAFGPKEAVPIMIVAALLANASRVAVWWREVDWRATAVYTVPALPAAALGARTLVSLEPRLVEMALGGFFLAMVPVRRWLQRQGWRISLGQLALVGAGIGYLSGIVASTGPINTPFFLAYGLTKGAFIATEALGSLAVQLTKVGVLRMLGALPLDALGRGLIVGMALMAGSVVAKSFVQRVRPEQFAGIVDGTMILVGLALLWGDW